MSAMLFMTFVIVCREYSWFFYSSRHQIADIIRDNDVDTSQNLVILLD
jgi:hypothetical protein